MNITRHNHLLVVAFLALAWFALACDSPVQQNQSGGEVTNQASCHATNPSPLVVPPAEVKWERNEHTFGDFLRSKTNTQNRGTIWRQGTSAPINDQPHCHAC